MITLNGKKFARNDKEFVNTLFDKETAIGFYKPTKRSVILYNMQKERIGIINRHKVLCCATLFQGKYWHSLATIDEIGKYNSYRKENDEICEIVNRFSLDK